MDEGKRLALKQFLRRREYSSKEALLGDDFFDPLIKNLLLIIEISMTCEPREDEIDLTVIFSTLPAMGIGERGC